MESRCFNVVYADRIFSLLRDNYCGHHIQYIEKLLQFFFSPSTIFFYSRFGKNENTYKHRHTSKTTANEDTKTKKNCIQFFLIYF